MEILLQNWGQYFILPFGTSNEKYLPFLPHERGLVPRSWHSLKPPDSARRPDHLDEYFFDIYWLGAKEKSHYANKISKRPRKSFAL